MLKNGQYEYITRGYENERFIDFDWTKHTLYLRMRYVAAKSYSQQSAIKELK